MSQDNPGLLRFVPERLEEDRALIVEGAPVSDADGGGAFYDRFIDRNRLYGWLETEHSMVTEVAAAMDREQNPTDTTGELGPVTQLGSDILATYDARYADHFD